MRFELKNARARLQKVTDDEARVQLERDLDRTAKLVSKLRAARRPLSIGIDEAVALVSKIVTNRQQAAALHMALRELLA